MPVLKIFLILLMLMPNNFKVQSDSALTKTKKDQLSKVEVQKLEKKVDSLEAKIEEHNIKESFFSSQLVIQTGIFSAIITILLAGAAFVSIKYYKKKINELKGEFHNLKTENFEMNARVARNTSNFFFLLGREEVKKGWRFYAQSLDFMLASLQYEIDHLEYKEDNPNYEVENKEEEVKPISARIPTIEKTFDSISKLDTSERDNVINKLKEYKKDHYDIFARILSHNFTKINDEILKINSQYSDFLVELEKSQEDHQD